MSIGTRTADSVTILDLSGKITLGESSVELRNRIRELVKSGHKNILLNLGSVSHMDSSGIGELVSAYTSVTNNGGQLKLLNLTKKLHELLAITKLLTVFECYENESQALQAFRR
ncbi:MAG: STAS domain-containing protein [Acidobacteria bacterium]|nr:STAS domain-containing protein [Acidobacteriota bacterium]